MDGWIHPSTHCSMGSAPVGVQCPFTSSLGEFPGYWDWFWYPGLSPLLVSIAFPVLPSISHCFSIHSSLPAIEYHSCFFFTTDVSAPTGWPFIYSLCRWVSRLRTGSGVPNVVVPEAEQGCAWSRNLISNFCPGRGLNLGPCCLMAANVYH